MAVWLAEDLFGFLCIRVRIPGGLIFARASWPWCNGKSAGVLPHCRSSAFSFLLNISSDISSLPNKPKTVFKNKKINRKLIPFNHRDVFLCFEMSSIIRHASERDGVGEFNLTLTKLGEFRALQFRRRIAHKTAKYLNCVTYIIWQNSFII